MKIKKSILELCIWACRFNFGSFEPEEFKKFFRMGLILFVIIGIYWTLKPLKDAIFIQLVNKMHIPFAKTLSIIILLPIIILYNQLIENFSREKMFIILSMFYGISILCFSILINIAQSTTNLLFFNKILGYIWYVFVESFGSFFITLFWSFSTDTTQPSSAKKGFALIYLLGQTGGIFLPLCIGGLPYYLKLTTDSLSVVILGLLTICIIPLFKSFLHNTPKNLLTSYQQPTNNVVKNNNYTAGFLDGLTLLLNNSYLVSILAITCMYEIIITIFDFNFKLAAGTHYSGVALSHYFNMYSANVNIVTVFCLLCGTNNIPRFLGIGITLTCMPIIIALGLLGFISIDSLSFLFYLMIIIKSTNFALNNPAIKQLYIPTTKAVKFKTQAWIEIFGARSAKEIGSIFNMSLNPLQTIFGHLAGKIHYLTLSGIIGFPLIIIWIIFAVYLGNKFKKAIDHKQIIC